MDGKIWIGPGLIFMRKNSGLPGACLPGKLRPGALISFNENVTAPLKLRLAVQRCRRENLSIVPLAVSGGVEVIKKEGKPLKEEGRR